MDGKQYDPWRAVGWAEAQARVNAEREGGVAQLAEMRVEGRETGRVWGHNAKPGPLDGQPERQWWAIAVYADGSRQEWGPTAS